MVAVIPARGGSKRIPRKNIRDFCGRPIVSYSIEAALKCGLFDEVMVSTEDEEIAAISREYGAQVPFMRSGRTSDDHATTAEVLLEVLGEYERRGSIFDAVCCIYPCAPFVTAGKLEEAVSLFRRSGATSVFPVVRYSYPPQRGLVERRGAFSFWMPENADARSQDLEPLYHDAGQFYVCSSEGLREARSLVGSNAVGIEVSEMEAQDIDNASDWELAEVKYRMMLGGQSG